MSARDASAPWDGAVSIDVPTAQRWILDQIEPLAPIELPLSETLGLVLAADARASEPSPAFDTSAMDGYAVRRSPGALTSCTVVGRSDAGSPFAGDLDHGEAVRIMTGARVPNGADAVVPLEEVSEGDGAVVIAADVALGAHIRRCGVDHAAGDVVVVKETRLAAAHVAVLASIRLRRPRVVPFPRVGVLSTGDEVVGPAPKRSGIRDVNRPGLIALLEASGATAVDLGVVGDDPAELTSRLDGAARECDAIITSGGVSVGDLDHTKRALARAARASGGVSRWMRVAVRPAKPLMFATIGATPVFGLPGNPASAFVSYHLFARPALDRLAGRSQGVANGTFTAFAATDFVRNRDGRLHVVPVIARLTDGVMSILPAGSGHRHHLAATAGANAYAYLADGPTVPEGALISCDWMSGAQAR